MMIMEEIEWNNLTQNNKIILDVELSLCLL